MDTRGLHHQFLQELREKNNMHSRTSAQNFVTIHTKRGYVWSLECGKKKPEAHNQSAKRNILSWLIEGQIIDLTVTIFHL